MPDPNFVDLLIHLIPPAILGGIFSVFFHEFLHWSIDRVFTREITFGIDGIDPNVQLNAPYEIPTWALRMSAAAPFIVGSFVTIISIWLANPYSNPTFWRVFFLTLGVTTALPSLGSGGDILALFAPVRFQEFAASTEDSAPTFSEAISIVLNSESKE